MKKIESPRELMALEALHRMNIRNEEKKEKEMKKRILVIEDGKKHQEDAREFFTTQPDVEVVYAKNYDEARKIMFARDEKTREIIKGNIDAVISDIYFPLTHYPKWNQPEPIGIQVAVEMSQLGVPFVLNTAGYHHGRRYEWINGFARKQGWSLIDTGRNYEVDSDKKDWERAFKTLNI